MYDAEHLSISINRSPHDTYMFAANPLNLPAWAAGLAGAAITRDGNVWIAQAPFGKVRISFAPQNAYGVIDHDVELESGAVVHNPMRVVANGDGSEFVFTLFRRPDMTDEQFAADRDAVKKDLLKLKQILEARK